MATAAQDWEARAATAGLSADHWLEQARRAKDYALKRPPCDFDGVFAALRDAAAFERLAASASA